MAASLRVLEIQHTLMGESNLQGYPCTIIRLAGCNLNCKFCDTPTKKDTGEELSIKQLVASVAHKRVLITGGEPLLQLAGVKALIIALKHKDRIGASSCEVIIETNGSISLESIPGGSRLPIVVMDIKTPSSGEMTSTLWDNMYLLTYKDELKFVIADMADLQYSRTVLQQWKDLPRMMQKFVFSPAWPLDKVFLPILVEAVKELSASFDIRLQLQMHKILEIA